MAAEGGSGGRGATDEAKAGAKLRAGAGAPVVAFVVAVAENGVIGNDGRLPWRLASDLKMFRRLTLGKPILMGRRTWESLPKKPLDQRDNIVVTRTPGFLAEGAELVEGPEAALHRGLEKAAQRGADEIAVIGGASLYEALMEKAGRLYWTTVHGAPDGDTIFPEFDWQAWELVWEEALPRGDRDDYAATLKVYERRP